MKKKVCFVVPSFPRVSETFVTNHVLQAKLQGYRIQLLVRNKLPISESSQKELLVKHDILNDVHTIDFKIPRDKYKRRFKAFIFTIRFLKYWLQFNDVSFRKRFSTLPFQLAFYNQFREVSVFHVQFAMAGIELAKMKSIGLLQGDIITTFHGYDAHFKDNKELILLQQRYNLLFTFSKYITVNTDYLFNKLALLGANTSKIRIIPMGIDTSFFKPIVEKSLLNTPLIKLISIGRLIELKGFAYALKSIKQIVEKGYKVEYTIVGEGIENENLKELISELQLNSNVVLIGSKSQKEIKILLDNSHIFLMSSVTDSTNRAEAQGVVTAEAQAMGLPVVAFNSGGVSYTINDNETGFLIEEKDINAYTEGVIKLLDNPDLYEIMSASAIKLIKYSFDSDLLAQRFFKLYE